MRKIPLLMLVIPALAFGQGVSGPVTTSRISRNSPAHYVSFTLLLTTQAAGTPMRYHYPFTGSARLVDVVVTQVSSGVGGTSWSWDVKNSAGTSLLSALGVATLASGANKSVDAKGDISLPSGWTRPAIKTDTTPDIIKGSYLDVVVAETGTYSTHVTALVTLVFEPKQ